MKKKQILELPFNSTTQYRASVLCTDAGNLSIEVYLLDDQDRPKPHALKFLGPRAFRQRSEAYCKAWHIESALDTVCEIEGSDWVSELRRDCYEMWKDAWVMRHFLIFLSDFGCVEVVAQDVRMEALALSEALG